MLRHGHFSRIDDSMPLPANPQEPRARRGDRKRLTGRQWMDTACPSTEPHRRRSLVELHRRRVAVPLCPMLSRVQQDVGNRVPHLARRAQRARGSGPGEPGRAVRRRDESYGQRARRTTSPPSPAPACSLPRGSCAGDRAAQRNARRESYRARSPREAMRSASERISGFVATRSPPVRARSHAPDIPPEPLRAERDARSDAARAADLRQAGGPPRSLRRRRSSKPSC